MRRPNKAWQGLIKSIAPRVGLALGGPFAGLATQTLANTLFPDQSGVKQSASLTKLLSGPLTGDAVMLEKLRQAEKKFDVQMRKLDVEIETLHVQDRNAARHRQEKLGDYWPNLLGIMVLLCFFATVAYILMNGLNHLDSTTAAFSGTLVGYVSAKADQVIAYFFGSSSGSREKTRAMADALHNGAPPRNS